MKIRCADAVIIRPGNNCHDNTETHKTRWFKKIWSDLRYQHFILSPETVIVDPFARNCEIARPNTNDLNPDAVAINNLCASEYLQSLRYDFADLLIFDPPFSERMAKDNYDGFGINLYSSDSKLMTRCLKDCGRVIKPGGYLLKFGFNINQPAKCFELVGLWLIEKTGHRNTTIVGLWKNNQGSIYEWF